MKTEYVELNKDNCFTMEEADLIFARLEQDVTPTIEEQIEVIKVDFMAMLNDYNGNKINAMAINTKSMVICQRIYTFAHKIDVDKLIVKWALEYHQNS